MYSRMEKIELSTLKAPCKQKRHLSNGMAKGMRMGSRADRRGTGGKRNGWGEVEWGIEGREGKRKEWMGGEGSGGKGRREKKWKMAQGLDEALGGKG